MQWVDTHGYLILEKINSFGSNCEIQKQLRPCFEKNRGVI